ncbi:MAG: hypothetical protein RI996_348 [Candidatus Parcubacteria bacterium]|jgi:hypothetical protein
MKQIYIVISLVCITVFTAQTAFALDKTKGVAKLLSDIGGLVDMSIAILVTLALAVFFWGLVKYIFKLGGKGGDGGRALMIYGIIALFVMVSIWGLTKFVGDFIGIDKNASAPDSSKLLPK